MRSIDHLNPDYTYQGRALVQLPFIGREYGLATILASCIGLCTKFSFNSSIWHLWFPGELIVIVEYCKFGCIHTYLQRHREVFIDQLTESKEKGFGRVNRGFSSSSANSGWVQKNKSTVILQNMVVCLCECFLFMLFTISRKIRRITNRPFYAKENIFRWSKACGQ